MKLCEGLLANPIIPRAERIARQKWGSRSSPIHHLLSQTACLRIVFFVAAATSRIIKRSTRLQPSSSSCISPSFTAFVGCRVSSPSRRPARRRASTISIYSAFYCCIQSDGCTSGMCRPSPRDAPASASSPALRLGCVRPCRGILLLLTSPYLIYHLPPSLIWPKPIIYSATQQPSSALC